MSSRTKFIRENLLSARASALYYMIVLGFNLTADTISNEAISSFQLFAAPILVVVIFNAWSLYRAKKGCVLTDEREQEIGAQAMAWAFFAVMILFSLQIAEIVALTAAETASIGFTVWFLLFFSRILDHRYGGKIR